MRSLTCTLLAALSIATPMAALATDPEPSIPKEIVSPSSVGEVIFPHSKHVDELEFDCGDCHHETRAAVLDMPHPEYLEDFWIDCAICHRAESAPLTPLACSTCHPSSPKSVADQTLSAKVVIHRSCWGCHESGSGETATMSCSLCHNRERISAPRLSGATEE